MTPDPATAIALILPRCKMSTLIVVIILNVAVLLGFKAKFSSELRLARIFSSFFAVVSLDTPQASTDSRLGQCLPLQVVYI